MNWKKLRPFWLPVALCLVISAIVVFACLFAYKYNADFRSLFSPNQTETVGKAEAAQTLAARNARAGRYSLAIFTGITVMQILALFAAYVVISAIKRSDEAVPVKLAKLANSESFLDLPLYIGLFGSVSSFMVMSFSSMSGQLIAYSSTLIGIIFSTVVRLTLMYPYKSKLIAEAGVEGLAKVKKE